MVDVGRVMEIKERVRMLTEETLHGPVPMKTTMQLVEDVSYLLEVAGLDKEVGDDKHDMIS